MALVRQCDRCGNIFDHAVPRAERNGIVTVSLNFGSNNKFEYYDSDIHTICPACMTDFRKWFKEVNFDETT